MCDSLDRDQASCRGAFRTICKTLKTQKIDLNNVTVSPSTINRRRINNRIYNYNKLKQILINKHHLILHFDNITIKDNTTNKLIDHAVIKVSSLDFEKLIGTVKCDNSKALTIYDAIMKKLDEFNIKNKIISLSYDNCPTNVEHHNGVVKLLLDKLNPITSNKLMKLPCRLHIFEVQLKKVFFELFPGKNINLKFIF